MNKLFSFLITWLRKSLGDKTAYEIPSPMPRFTLEDLSIEDGKITISHLKMGTYFSTVTDTGSEEPLVDAGNFLILEPYIDQCLFTGDWVVYEDSKGTSIAHHIIAVNFDTYGTWFEMMGTNCVEPDPEGVRVSKIKYLVRGVLY